MPKHQTRDYTIKYTVETKRYIVVLFSTPLFDTWSVFIPKSEIKNGKDYKKIEEAIRKKIEELKSETKGVRYIGGLKLHESDMNVLLSLLLEGPCESVYSLYHFKKRGVVKKTTGYRVVKRLLSYELIKKTPVDEDFQYEVTLPGLCVLIKEGVEQIFQKRDKIISENIHLLPIIFRYWEDFDEQTKNDIWYYILKYVSFMFDTRLSYLNARHPLLSLDEIEPILKYDLTRFIVFPWLYELEDSFLSSHIAPETKSKNRKRLDKVPDDVKKAVKSLKKFAKKTRKKHIRDWISTLSKFETIKDFISKESDRLEKLFDQSLRTIKECSSIARNYDKLGIYSRKNH